ncbi:MAG: YdbC family protein [Ignavibacteriales bacterium]
MADIKFEIISTLGVLSEGSKGWQKEINIVRWNDRSPKLDIREWGPEHERMGKGVTLSKEEAVKLVEIIRDLDVETLDMD